MTTPAPPYMVCPQCNQQFALGEEEFCPNDGQALVLPPQAASAPQAPTNEMPKPTVTTNIPQPQTTVHPSQPGGTPLHDAAPPHEAVPEPSSEEKPLAEDDKQSRITDFLNKSKKKVRETFSFNRGGTPPAEESPLPPALQAAGWRVTGTVLRKDAFDLWPVSNQASSASGQFSRYLAKVLSQREVLARLKNPGTSIARVHDFGTVISHSDIAADYVLTELPAGFGTAQSLDAWLLTSPPSENRALSLLPALVQLLVELENNGIRPISLSPDVLLRNAQGRLCLNQVAALTDTTERALDYRPALERNPLLPQLWTAPELLEELVLIPQAAVFSVGQLLAIAWIGAPLSRSELRTGTADFRKIQDARLARILMGCLWVHTREGLWNLTQLQTAATAATPDLWPDVPNWDSLGPQACSAAFSLGGKAYWRVEDCLRQANQPELWDEAVTRLEALLDWAESSHWAGAVARMREELRAGRSADWVLVHLTQTVVPQAQKIWRGLDLDDAHARESLVALAIAAQSGDGNAQEMVAALFKADLRGAFAHPHASF